MVVINRPVKVDPTKLQSLIEMACNYCQWADVFGIMDITDERFCIMVKQEGICHAVDLETIKKALATMPEKHFNDFMNGNDDRITADIFLRACVSE